MKRKVLLIVVALFCASLVAICEERPVYLDANASPEARAEDLLARMTLEEKVGQVTQIEIHRLQKGFWGGGELDPDWLQKVLVDYAVGSILSGGDGVPAKNAPAGWAKMTNTIQEWAQKTRLKIPVLYGIDAVHGHNGVVGAAIYPHNLGMAATFDPAGVEEYGRLTADEVRATGIHWTFAPVLDVARDPRWGRTVETFGEDPYLVGVMGASVIRGFQSTGKVMACGKHFLGYSAAENGLDRNPADFSERALREIHLPPYRAAMEAGLGSIMVNSGEVNGVPAHASRWLLTEVLRNELGFTGLAVSDWEDVAKLASYHRVAGTLDEAIARAYNAGLDMNMVPMDLAAADRLANLVRKGIVPEARLDEAVKRVLVAKFKLGLFEDPFADPARAEKLIGSPESRDLARRLARESLVLLKNENEVLPISPKKIKSVLVVGQVAESLSYLCGPWTVHWRGARDEEIVGQSILGALKARLPAGIRLAYLPRVTNKAEAERAARGVDLVIAVLGEKPDAEGNADSQELRLPPDQEEMVRLMAETGRPLAVVVVAGRPLVMPWLDTRVSALLWAFYPGNEGGTAIAEVLLGMYNPSGRLPIGFPKSVGQLPQVYNCRRTARYDPLFPFGHGLSYTKFAYSELKVPERVRLGMPVTVSVKVKNAGPVAGDEVVLLFLRDEVASVTQPAKSLRAFTRIHLAPGEERAVNFTLSPEDLSILDEDLKPVQEPGWFTIFLGGLEARFFVAEG
ncbi:MAG: beta-glucosidase [Firmicutes bacterium]|nr:beta-glucosidase [Bacillota bacterium]